MKPVLCCALAMLAACTVFAQKNNYAEPVRYTAIKWNHIAFINPFSPMCVLGAESRKNRYSMCLQGGVAMPIGYTRDTFVKGKTGGYTLRLDGKKYFKGHRKDFENLLGIEAFYTQYSNTDMGFYKDTLHIAPTYQDTLVYRKKMFGVAVIAGAQHRVTKHLLVQVYTGLGLKIKDVLQEGSILPGYRDTKGSTIGGNETGTYLTVAVPFHFSVAYYF